MNNQNILFVMPGLNGGGAERVVSQIASMFANKEYKVRIILTEDQTCIYPLDERIDVRYIGKQMPNPIEQIRFIRKNVKEWSNCIVISFLDNQNIFSTIALLGKQNKLIVSERNDPAQVRTSRRILKNLFYHFADVIVFQTDDARKFYPKALQRRGVIIPNPIKEKLPNPYTGVRRKCFVTYSRLTAQKNIPMMLKAFALFHEKYPTYRLEIYGKGSGENELKNLTCQLGIKEYVDFKGFCENVHSEIVDCVGYLSSSDYEGISNSMIEAMAIGLPVICTDCPAGGARMFIESGKNGILIPVKDEIAMATAMCYVVKGDKVVDTLSQNAVKIREKLRIDKIFTCWEELVK